MSDAYGGRQLLVDKSAWVRAQGHEWEHAIAAGQLWICEITRLEILYSARDGADLADLDAACDAFRQAKVNGETLGIARSAMRELAGRGEHRVSLPDLIVAACAQQHGLDVLHVDRHFDVLGSVLAFAPVRLTGD